MGRRSKEEMQRLECMELLDKYHIKDIIKECDDINNDIYYAITNLDESIIKDIVNTSISTNKNATFFDISLNMFIFGYIEMNEESFIFPDYFSSTNITLYDRTNQSYKKIIYTLPKTYRYPIEKEDYDKLYTALRNYGSEIFDIDIPLNFYNKVKIIPSSKNKLLSLNDILINKFTSCGYKVMNSKYFREHFAYIIRIENPAIIADINSIVKSFIDHIENTNSLQVITSYESIDAFFNNNSNESYLNNEYIDIIAADTKLNLIRLEKHIIDNKNVYKLITDITLNNGDNFSTKSIFYTKEKLENLVNSIADSLDKLDLASFYKYTEALRHCVYYC